MENQHLPIYVGRQPKNLLVTTRTRMLVRFNCLKWKYYSIHITPIVLLLLGHEYELARFFEPTRFDAVAGRNVPFVFLLIYPCTNGTRCPPQNHHVSGRLETVGADNLDNSLYIFWKVRIDTLPLPVDQTRSIPHQTTTFRVWWNLNKPKFPLPNDRLEHLSEAVEGLHWLLFHNGYRRYLFKQKTWVKQIRCLINTFPLPSDSLWYPLTKHGDFLGRFLPSG